MQAFELLFALQKLKFEYQRNEAINSYSTIFYKFMIQGCKKLHPTAQKFIDGDCIKIDVKNDELVFEKGCD